VGKSIADCQSKVFAEGNKVNEVIGIRAIQVILGKLDW
jgi:hypothetical protein